MVEQDPPIHLLLIEDNAGDALLTRSALESVAPGRYCIVHVESLNAAAAPLGRQRFDAILLDLALPDTRGLATLTHLRSLAQNVPIVVLTGTDDEKLVMEAVNRGAQDCLTKGTADGRDLTRAIRYALDRQRATDALRQSEQRLRFHVENTPLGVVEWDSDFVVTRWSEAAEHIFGWTAAETLGRKIDQLRLVYEEDEPIVQSVMARLTDGQTRHVVSANRNYTRDGRVIYCEWYNSVLMDARGKMASVLSLVLDDTKRKEAEDRLRQWNQGLEARVQERTAALALAARRLQEENAQRREAQRQLEAYQRNLQAMAHQVMVAEERERHRLAIDLHDGLGQTLVLAKMKLTDLRRDAGAAPVAAACQDVVNLIDEARHATSSLTFKLSPPVLHLLGLTPAARWLAEDLAQRYGLRVEVDDDGLPKPMDEQVMVMLFRATRELLINVAKHAQTKQAQVSLRAQDGRVRVTVEDRGVGFDPALESDVIRDRSAAPVAPTAPASGDGDGDGESGTGGFGLFSLRERLNYLGGSMEVRSSRGQGTAVTLVAPLAAPASKRDQPAPLAKTNAP